MMKIVNQKVIVVLCSILFVPWIGMQGKRNALDTFVKSQNLENASVGVDIVDLSTGKSVCSHNENLALCPASNLKLITTASALEILGSNFLFKTTLFTDGAVDAQGILKGNVYIQGGGDPTLGSEFFGESREEFLKDWFSAIRKEGIKGISGSVIALDGLYGYEGISPKWTWEDIGNYYAPGTYGISIFDNMYRLYLQSSGLNDPVSVIRLEPEIPGLKIDVSGLKAAPNSQDSAYIYGIPFSYDRRVFGSIPMNSSSFVIKGDIPDPGLFLANYFQAYLKKNGIAVAGNPSTARLQPVQVDKKKELIVSYSKSISDIIRVTNVKSNNHFAQHLFFQLSPEGKPGDLIKSYWKKQGVYVGGLNMYDGCGLSTVNTVTVRTITEVLAYMNSKSKSSSLFYQSLPIAGQEGTVASFLKNTKLAGKARVKSGSIRGVLSYSGYIDANGKKYAFSVIVNNYEGSLANLRTQMGQLLEGVIYDSNGNR